MPPAGTGDVPDYITVWSADFNDPDNFFYTFFAEHGTVTRSFNNMNPEMFAAWIAPRPLLIRQALPSYIKNWNGSSVVKTPPERARWRGSVYVVQPRVKNFVVLEWVELYVVLRNGS